MCQGTPCNKSIFSKHIFESQRWALEAPKLSSKAMLLLVTRPSKTSSRKTLSKNTISLSLATLIWFTQHGTRGECPAVRLCGGGEGRRSLGQQKLDLLHCRHLDNCLLKVFDSNVITMGLFGQSQLLQGMNLIVTPQHKEPDCHCHCITL